MTLEEKDEEQSALSVIQTLIVSTATRVGMGNLVGVVAAISAGGAGAVFWMWVTALIGSSTAFIESTLSQIYIEKDPLYGGYRGGPAFYIHRYFEEKSSHDGNDNIQNFYSCIFSKYDNCGKYYKNNCSVNRWNVKSIFKSRCYGITYYLTDAAPAYKAGNGKEYGKKYITFFLAGFFFKISMNVVSRSSSISSI